MTREDLVKVARHAVGGIHRPPERCYATYTNQSGAVSTTEVVCENALRNPASYDPPEWVLEAMLLVYQLGVSYGRVSGLADHPEGCR